MKKVPTGIEGLDEMLDGGFPSGRPILVCGAPGSGKTIFAMQFLCNGAVQHGERGVFVSLDESKPHLLQDMDSFGWNLLELEKKQLISIVDASPPCVGVSIVPKGSEALALSQLIVLEPRSALFPSLS